MRVVIAERHLNVMRSAKGPPSHELSAGTLAADSRGREAQWTATGS